MNIEDLMIRANRAVRDWIPEASITAVEPLRGGASSLTYLATVRGGPASDENIVLKVAPPGVKPVGNRDVLRQARLLAALEGTPGLAVPRVLFADAGAPVEVPPFFAMSFVAGDSFEPHIDVPDNPNPPGMPPAVEIEGRARSAARMLAALHGVPLQAKGLGDEPEIALSAEVERWVKLFATVDEDLKPGSVEVGNALIASLPAPVPSCLTHGDYRLGNTLCRGNEVVAVIDWEIWSRGDPRVDLAWFLLTADPKVHPSAVRDAPGMPRPDVLLGEYEAATDRRVRDLGWFQALVLFKLASISAQIAKHKRRGGDPTGEGARAAQEIPTMLERARAQLAN
nr:phosphotransferase family protein [Aromatoleum petrolei]